MFLWCADGAALLEAFAAKNGAALRGAEGNGGFLAALRATGFGFRAHGRGGATAALGTLGFAALAAFRLVLKTLVGEEHLFAAGKNKFGTALRALQYPIVVFHSRYPPDLPRARDGALADRAKGNGYASSTSEPGWVPGAIGRELA